MLLKDMVALITGGAKGMGKGVALKFAEEGCAIAIADISTQEASDTIAEVKKIGRTGLALQCDATNEGQVKRSVDQVIKQFGKIDILVNNAGGLLSTPPIENMTEDQWDKVIDLNLKSAFLFSKYVAPQMKTRRFGKVINISSIGAINPPSHSIHYASAKAGLLGFTYDLAFALAPYNINVNAILPGPIRTHFYDKMIAGMSDQQIEEFFINLGKVVPLQRMGTPEDIGGAALFLASSLSSFVTGTSILVSGGLPLSVNHETGLTTK